MPNFFALSLSLQVGVVAAFVAMTLTLRRPGARLWALFWVSKFLSGAIAASTVTATPAYPLAQPRLWTTLVSVVTGSTLFFLLRAGWWQFKPGARWNVAWRVAVAFMVPYLFFGLSVPAASATSADFGWYALYARAGGLPTDALLLAVTLAFRRRTDRAAATLLTAGFAISVIRDAASAAYIVPRLGTAAVVASPPFLSVVQLGAMVVVALGSLFAVLADEREAMGQLAAEVERVRTYETLGRMAGGVAHDFNNLLTVIGMSIAGGEEEDGPLTLRAHEVKAIDDAVEQGREMVGTLMTFARQEATATAVKFDLHELILAHEAQLRKLVPESQSVQFTLADDPCPVLGDPRGMLRLLNNLVANARDAMTGGGRVTIGTAVRARGSAVGDRATGVAARPHVSLTVSDEGSGIPAEVLPRIFDPFFSTKAPGKGTGLGLALAQAYVRGAGGDIRVRESTARGTTFEVVLPLAA